MAQLRWPAVNRQLKAAGFEPISQVSLAHLGSKFANVTVLSEATTATLQQTLTQLVTAGQRYDPLIDDLEQGIVSAKQRANHAETALQLQHDSHHALQTECGKQAQRLLHEQSLRQTEQQQHTVHVTALEARVAQLLEQKQRFQRRIDAEQDKCRTIQARLNDTLQAENKRSQRLNGLFEQLTHRRAHSKSAVDKRVLDVIELYERQVLSLKQEVQHVQALTRDLKSDLTHPLPMDQPVTSTSSSHALQRELDAAQHMVECLQAKLDSQLALATAQQTQIDAMTLELQGRPSPSVWQSTQARMQKLEQASKRPKSAHVVTPVLGPKPGKKRHDPLHYKLHLYHLQSQSPQALRNTLDQLCRLVNSSPSRLVEVCQRQQQLLQQLPGLATVATSLSNITEAYREVVAGRATVPEPTSLATALSSVNMPAQGPAAMCPLDLPRLDSSCVGVIARGMHEMMTLRHAQQQLQQQFTTVASMLHPWFSKGTVAVQPSPLYALTPHCFVLDPHPPTPLSPSDVLDRLGTLLDSHQRLAANSQSWLQAEQAMHADVQRDGGNALLRCTDHLMKVLRLDTVAAVAPAVSKLQDDLQAHHNALKQLLALVAPDVEYHGPHDTLKHVRNTLANLMSSADHRTYEQLLEALQADQPTAVPRLRNVLQHRADLTAAVTRFEAWTAQLLALTGTPGLDACLQAVGALLQYTQQTMSKSAPANTVFEAERQKLQPAAAISEMDAVTSTTVTATSVSGTPTESSGGLDITQEELDELLTEVNEDRGEEDNVSALHDLLSTVDEGAIALPTTPSSLTVLLADETVVTLRESPEELEETGQDSNQTRSTRVSFADFEESPSRQETATPTTFSALPAVYQTPHARKHRILTRSADTPAAGIDFAHVATPGRVASTPQPVENADMTMAFSPVSVLSEADATNLSSSLRDLVDLAEAALSPRAYEDPLQPQAETELTTRTETGVDSGLKTPLANMYTTRTKPNDGPLRLYSPTSPQTPPTQASDRKLAVFTDDDEGEVSPMMARIKAALRAKTASKTGPKHPLATVTNR